MTGPDSTNTSDSASDPNSDETAAAEDGGDGTESSSDAPETTSASDAGNTTVSGNTTADDNEREWRFAVDEVGPDGITEQTATPDTEPIEPGSIDLEHAIFVVLGVVITLAVFFLGF